MIETIETNKIKADKNQPRENFDEKRLKEIAEAFKTTGMINPVEIDENNTIITGECRWRASKIAGLKVIPCIRKHGLTPKERLTRQLSENLARQSLSVQDQMKAIKKLITMQEATVRRTPNGQKKNSKGQFQPINGSVNDVARQIGVSERWIRDLLKIDKAPSTLKKAVKDYQETKGEEGISSSVAIEIMKADTSEEQEELTKDVLDNTIQGDHRTIRAIVKDKKNQKLAKKIYEKGKQSSDKQAQIITSQALLQTFRIELDNYFKATTLTKQKILTWKLNEYEWFDYQSKKELNKMLETTKQEMHKIIEAVEDFQTKLGGITK